MKRLLAIAALLLAATPALAGQAVTLKVDTTSADGIVTLGDLFDGAGAAWRTPVAAMSGPVVVLEALAVQAAARRAGLDWANAEGIRKILVRGGPGRGGVASAPRGNVEVLTYARNLAAGEIVQPTDVVWGKAAAAPSDAPSDADAVIGMAAKRPLRAGVAVSARDVGAALVIRMGDLITVTYEDEGISLALQARAMASAGVGDTLNVQNTVSNKILPAVVTGPGQAVVGPAADQMKAARASRYALR